MSTLPASLGMTSITLPVLYYFSALKPIVKKLLSIETAFYLLLVIMVLEKIFKD
jgi:hypothetical protein